MFCLTILFLHFLGRLAPALPVIGSTSASSVGSLDTSPAGCSSSWKLCHLCAFICFAYRLCPDTRLIVAMVGRCCVILAQCAQWLWQCAQFFVFLCWVCAWLSVADQLPAHQILLLGCASWCQISSSLLQWPFRSMNQPSQTNTDGTLLCKCYRGKAQEQDLLPQGQNWFLVQALQGSWFSIGRWRIKLCAAGQAVLWLMCEAEDTLTWG